MKTPELIYHKRINVGHYASAGTITREGDVLVTASGPDHWRSVSIVCEDSGLADALSTALFLLPLEEGKALLESCGAEAVWVDFESNMFYSDGFEKLIRT